MNLLKDKQVEDGNVFLSNLERGEWNDIQAYHIESKLVWRNVAILAIVAMLIISLAAIYVVNQDQHKVLVFEKDGLGNITTLGLTSETLSIDNKIIAHQLDNFIVALREVPIDVTVKKRNINLVHNMIEPKLRTKVDQMIIEQYVKAQNSQIEVEVTSIKPLANSNSWEINWLERKTSLNNVITVTNWSTNITFRRLSTIAISMAIINPTGLFITYLHPVEDINDKGG